jgi:hypothetical protein
MTAVAAPETHGLTSLARLPSASDRPQWLRIIAGAVIVATVVLGLVLAGAARDVHNGIDVIGHRTAPAISATEDLSFALSDMDAQLANIVLAGGDASLAQNKSDAATVFDRRGKQADADLLMAATVVGSDDAAQRPLRAIADDLGDYRTLADDIILLDAQQDNAAGQPSAEILAKYRRATGLMEQTLWPAAQAVTNAHGGAKDVLNRSYTDTAGSTVTARWWLGALGAVILVVLVGAQVWLRRTVRRRVNPGLAAATVVVAGWLVLGCAAMGTAAHQLSVAKQDAFDSIFALSDARAVSIDARADESRALLDPDQSAGYLRGFATDTQRLSGGPGSTPPVDTDVAATAYRLRDQDEFDQGSDIGRELRNITFPGEEQAAFDAVITYQKYQDDARELRGKAGAAAIAVDTDTSDAHDTENYDFSEYVNSLDTLIGINQNAFDRAVADGDRAMDGWTGQWPYGAVAVVIALVVAGVWPRLAEYR